MNWRAQWWAPEQASRLIVQGASEATSSSSLLRATNGLTSTGWPASLTPWTAKTLLAKSMPTKTMLMVFPLAVSE